MTLIVQLGIDFFSKLGSISGTQIESIEIWIDGFKVDITFQAYLVCHDYEKKMIESI